MTINNKNTNNNLIVENKTKKMTSLKSPRATSKSSSSSQTQQQQQQPHNRHHISADQLAPFSLLGSEDPWQLYSPTTEAEVSALENQVQQQIFHNLVAASASSVDQPQRFFFLNDVVPFLNGGAQAIYSDSFTQCFRTEPPVPWNWNVYLFPVWCLGVLVRYVVLMPLRVIALIVGTAIMLPFIVAVNFFGIGGHLFKQRLLTYYCSLWVMAMSGVIHRHGVPPLRRPNQIYVANHTTVLDVVVLMQIQCMAMVGQRHGGLMGFFQKYVVGSMGVWFDRTNVHDRHYVSKKIREHIADPENPPVLIFPEGTCVNNRFCVQFKKGAFELDAEIVPVAIKYNPLFSNMFYNSKEQSFVQHVFRILTGWACVADVHYLEPVRRGPDESALDFAARVKSAIAHKAGLIDLPWDGLCKYVRPSPKLQEMQQRAFASCLFNRLQAGN
jgi:glycerol-3-phosphate O-acyltransferase 3/4